MQIQLIQVEYTWYRYWRYNWYKYRLYNWYRYSWWYNWYRYRLYNWYRYWWWDNWYRYWWYNWYRYRLYVQSQIRLKTVKILLTQLQIQLIQVQVQFLKVKTLCKVTYTSSNSEGITYGGADITSTETDTTSTVKVQFLQKEILQRRPPQSEIQLLKRERDIF